MTKQFTFFTVHYNAETQVKLGILPVVARVSEVMTTSEDVASWSSEAQEVLAGFGLPKSFTDAGLAHARQRSQTACEVVPQMELGFYYGGSDTYPQWSRTYPVTAMDTDPDLTADAVREWFEDLGRRSAAARGEIDAWRAKVRRNLNAALIDLREGFIFPEDGKTSLLIEEVLGKPLEELEYAYSSGPVLGARGPYGASLWLEWDRGVLEIRAAAKAACEAREAAEVARLKAAREARKGFQLRLARALEATCPELLERAERGLLPPDELLSNIVGEIMPSALFLRDVEGVRRDVEGVTLGAFEFEALKRLERELETSSAQAKAWGVEVELRLGLYASDYDEEQASILVVRVSDSTGSDWTRERLVSLQSY